MKYVYYELNFAPHEMCQWKGDRVTEGSEECATQCFNDNGLVIYYILDQIWCAIHLAVLFSTHSNVTWCFCSFPFALRSFYCKIHSIYAQLLMRACEAKYAPFISFHSCQLDSFAIFSAHKRNIYDTCVWNSKSIWFSIIGARIVRYIDSCSFSPTLSHSSSSILVFNLNDCDSFHLIGK